MQCNVVLCLIHLISIYVGQANCPYYARVELLADKLALNLPDFKLHKIVIEPGEWQVRLFLEQDYQVA